MRDWQFGQVSKALGQGTLLRTNFAAANAAGVILAYAF
jgi:hypothetical protein